ncbi:MAG: serine--tRNA ligase [Sphingobacteriales bacterium]|jgi:seryl-tRNA synthetase
MYDIKWIREHPEAFDRGLTRRGLEPLSKKLAALDEKRRAAITKFEQAQARRNAASKEIGEAKKAKDDAKANKLMAEVAELKTLLPAMEEEQKRLGAELDKELAQIPNTPLDEVPDGADASGNVEHRVFGKKRDYAFKPKQHFELGEALGQMDFELAAKLSGARFVVLQKGLARLERALGQFMLDLHTGREHGYTEVSPPLMVSDEVMFGTAQLPKFADDQFLSLNKRDLLAYATWAEVFNRADELGIDYEDKKNRSILDRLYDEEYEKQPQYQRRWLIPTAEVPLTNLVRESIVEGSQLPMRLTACTPCFRAEAGAAGKDTRGMIRQHQFTKVELVSITTPDKSKEEHERMLACAEEVLKKLDLHYRVVTLCTGDMSFAAQKTYDIEVWLPGQNAYREISSCSNCGEFQARRMNARYRAKDGVRHVHTLNGSGVAVGRALIAVMETYQQENGAIAVPSALALYMGGLKTIERA